MKCHKTKELLLEKEFSGLPTDLSEEEFAKRITIEFDSERPSLPADITVAGASFNRARSLEGEILSAAEEVGRPEPTFLLKPEDI